MKRETDVNLLLLLILQEFRSIIFGVRWVCLNCLYLYCKFRVLKQFYHVTFYIIALFIKTEKKKLEKERERDCARKRQWSEIRI